MIFGSNVEKLMSVVNEDVSRKKGRDKKLFGCVWTLENWKERKKKLKSNFLSIVWFKESQKDKK